VAHPSVSVLMTLSDLESLDARGRFLTDLLNNARRATKFGRITRVGRGIFMLGQLRPYRKGAEPKRNPVFMVLLCLCLYFLTQNDQIWHGNTWRGACFRGSTTPLHLHKCFVRFVSDSRVSRFLPNLGMPGYLLSDANKSIFNA